MPDPIPNYFKLLKLPLIPSKDRIQQGKKTLCRGSDSTDSSYEAYLSRALATHPGLRLLGPRTCAAEEEQIATNFRRVAHAYLVLNSRKRRRRHRRRVREHEDGFSNDFEPTETLDEAYGVFE